VTAARRTTKTRARQLADRQLSHGYTSPGTDSRTGQVRCPLCQAKLGAERYDSHHTDTGRRRLLVKALKNAVVTHLTSEYDDDRCPKADG
jgi:hypothetical protein